MDIGIAGGGEKLNPTFSPLNPNQDPVKLTTTLRGQLTLVEELIFDAYSEIRRVQ